MIVNEIFYLGVNKYFEQIMEGIGKEADPEKRLRIFIDRAIEVLQTNRDFFKVYIEFLSKESDRPDVRKMLTTFYDKFMDTLQTIMKEGIAAGSFVQFDTEKLARAIYCLTVGSLFARYTMKVEFDLTEQNHFQIDSILSSIKK